MTLIHLEVEVIFELKVGTGTLPPGHHPHFNCCSSPNTLGVCPGTVDILLARELNSPAILRLYILFVPK
jgi:hypothetical protein